MRALLKMAEALGGAWTSSPGSWFAHRAHPPVQDAEEDIIPPGLAALARHPDRRRILGPVTRLDVAPVRAAPPHRPAPSRSSGSSSPGRCRRSAPPVRALAGRT